MSKPPRPNLIERTIAAIAPQAALRRAIARAQLSNIRAYEGAQKNRRTTGWNTARATGPIAEVRAGRVTLRDRSRDLVRNNAWGHRAVKIKVANQVGTGIRPRAAGPDQALNDRIDAAFEAWQADCAPESGTDFYGLQHLVARARSESGEALVLLDKSKRDGVSLTLQALETDWLSDDQDTPNNQRDGWREGIKFDAAGRRTAYRLWNANPNEVGILSRRDTRDVPATDLLHIFAAERPGQIRGIPDLASAMMRLRDLDDYHDAALLLAKVQACLGVFVTQPGGPTASPMGTESADSAGNRLEGLSPGIVGYLNPGEGVEFLTPNGSGPFEPYTRIALHMIAAGFGITYHQLTGDLSQANYSSLRAGSLEFRRQIEQDQHLMLIPQLCAPIRRAFIQQAILGGVLPPAAANVPTKWTPPRFELVDPNRDTQALIAGVRAGLMTLPEAISEMGYDPVTQIAEIVAFNKLLTDGGVILDTDPRVMSGGGQPVDAKQLAAIVLAAKDSA